MNLLRKTTGIIFTLIIALSAIAVPTMASAKTKKIKFKNITVAVNSYKGFTYDWKYFDKLTFKSSNNKIAKVKDGENEYKKAYCFVYSATGSDNHATVHGFKKGNAKITVYKKGTKKVLGSFKVKVVNKKASVRKKFSKLSLTYNEKTKYLAKSSVYTALLVNDPKKGAKYTAEFKNKRIASTKTIKGFKANSIVRPTQEINAKKEGTTKINVYETLKGKKTRIGYLKVEVKRIDMEHVYKDYCVLDSMGDGGVIYFDEYFSIGDKLDLKERIVSTYLNNGNIKLNESDYTITFTNNNPEYLSLDDNGVVTILKDGSEDENYKGITYTIKFYDGYEMTESAAPYVQ